MSIRWPLVIILLGAAALADERTTSDAFVPGAIWHDTDGQPINAHGGGVLYHSGVYYWYGEFKAGQTFLPKVNQAWGGTRVLAAGVSCYSSRDLLHWKNEGLVLRAVADNPDHDLACENVIERPKVIYNARTQTFVMWFHQDSPDYAAARSGVAVSTTPTGPFRYLGSFRPNAGVPPLSPPVESPAADLTSTRRVEMDGGATAGALEGGQMARDMTLFVDDDGTAYQLYSSESNQTMHVSQLTDDYLRPAGRYVRIFIGQSIEAPAVFKHDGLYYLIGSGCTGWEPNPAHAAVAPSMFGPWRELGNPCRGPGAELTFRCQSTAVLPVAGQPGMIIALFDRWEKWDLAASRYVWLPIAFDAERHPVIRWRDRWTFSTQ